MQSILQQQSEEMYPLRAICSVGLLGKMDHVRKHVSGKHLAAQNPSLLSTFHTFPLLGNEDLL